MVAASREVLFILYIFSSLSSRSTITILYVFPIDVLYTAVRLCRCSVGLFLLFWLTLVLTNIPLMLRYIAISSLGYFVPLQSSLVVSEWYSRRFALFCMLII